MLLFEMNPMMTILKRAVVASAAAGSAAFGQLAIEADTLYPMTGDLKPIEGAVVVCSAEGKIVALGRKGEVKVPAGYTVLKAAVVTPGIVDAHATVGLSGLLNLDRHDQEQLERSAPIQPELRAIDAYNGRDPLVKWLRDLGVTTVHTGHAPGVLVAGQTMIIKTNVPSITKDDDLIRPVSMVAATLGSGSKDAKKSPGTRAKAVALLRGELLKAQAYCPETCRKRREQASRSGPPTRHPRRRAAPGDPPPDHGAPAP
jgi:imidazolonepropionase-like amidohydrolase